ncbi:MAG: hypothetical protein QM793_04830 [Muricomes sp.]
MNNPLNYCDPTERFFKEISNAVKNRLKSVGNWVKNTASNLWNDITGGGSSTGGGISGPSGYNPYTDGHITHPSGISYMPIQDRAAQMSNEQIGQLSSGLGLSGTQLERYQQQCGNVLRAEMKRKVCTAEQKKIERQLLKEVLKYSLKHSMDSYSLGIESNIDIDIQYNGMNIDTLEKIGGGIGSIAIGAVILVLSGGGEVLTGGAATPVAVVGVGAGASAVGAGAAQIGNALNNAVDVSISLSKGQNSGGSSKGDSSSNELKEVHNSIKDSPKYPEGFQPRKNGTTSNKVNNQELLEKLREIESGTWKKVYKDGYDAYGNEVSIHYFQSQSGKVFDVKVKPGWSN